MIDEKGQQCWPFYILDGSLIVFQSHIAMKFDRTNSLVEITVVWVALNSAFDVEDIHHLAVVVHDNHLIVFKAIALNQIDNVLSCHVLLLFVYHVQMVTPPEHGCKSFATELLLADLSHCYVR
jgi:hypothetical protein